ncbi:MAG TPA: threonylcarbamoyl-AMP synthase [Erysipelotrichaceae bacterium]|nr:threonylcarbamoyl-AMP synthase [Erysipelotrichaceae bacterium]
MYNADAMKRYKSSQIRELAEILKNDGAISVPTDTVYGVCARMDSEKAQEHLRDVKNRPLTKAFPLMCADAEQIRSIAYTDENSEKLIRAFMPGPVTLILKKREEVPAYVNGGMETVAVRMATDRQLYELIKETGSPLYMTSANQSGEATCTSLDEIEKACPLLDGMLEGETHFGKASTIIDCTKELPVILREGPVNMEDIKKALKEEEHA